MHIHYLEHSGGSELNLYLIVSGFVLAPSQELLCGSVLLEGGRLGSTPAEKGGRGEER